jgi:hypothetical protein
MLVGQRGNTMPPAATKVDNKKRGEDLPEADMLGGSSGFKFVASWAPSRDSAASAPQIAGP